MEHLTATNPVLASALNGSHLRNGSLNNSMSLLQQTSALQNFLASSHGTARDAYQADLYASINSTSENSSKSNGLPSKASSSRGGVSSYGSSYLTGSPSSDASQYLLPSYNTQSLPQTLGSSHKNSSSKSSSNSKNNSFITWENEEAYKLQTSLSANQNPLLAGLRNAYAIPSLFSNLTVDQNEILSYYQSQLLKADSSRSSLGHSLGGSSNRSVKEESKRSSNSQPSLNQSYSSVVNESLDRCSTPKNESKKVSSSSTVSDLSKKKQEANQHNEKGNSKEMFKIENKSLVESYICTTLLELYESKQNMDMKLISADDKTVVYAHAQFIGGCSPFLMSIFPESKCECMDFMTIIITDVSGACLEGLVQVLYTGMFPKDCFATNILYAAKALGLDEFVSEISEYLKEEDGQEALKRRNVSNPNCIKNSVQMPEEEKPARDISSELTVAEKAVENETEDRAVETNLSKRKADEDLVNANKKTKSTNATPESSPLNLSKSSIPVTSFDNTEWMKAISNSYRQECTSAFTPTSSKSASSSSKVHGGTRQSSSKSSRPKDNSYSSYQADTMANIQNYLKNSSMTGLSSLETASQNAYLNNLNIAAANLSKLQNHIRYASSYQQYDTKNDIKSTLNEAGALNLSSKTETPTSLPAAFRNFSAANTQSLTTQALFSGYQGFNPQASTNYSQILSGAFNLNKLATASTKSKKISDTSLESTSSPLPDEDNLIDDDGPNLGLGGANRKLLFPSTTRRRKGCGICENCLQERDCGFCRFCKDKNKYGGPNNLKQVCLQKRCVLTEALGKSKSRCGKCHSCLLTSDCQECDYCLESLSGKTPSKRQCEMRICEQMEMEEFRANHLKQVEEPSPYSTESLLAESPYTQTSFLPSSACSSPEEMIAGPGGMMRKKKKKKGKDGSTKGTSKVSRARTKYQCNQCWGCNTTNPCAICMYCVDMPKHGGEGRFRQKCVKQLCILHPRLQSNKLVVKEMQLPSQSELEPLLDGFETIFSAAKVSKLSMVNFMRLHHHEENSCRQTQVKRIIDILTQKDVLVRINSNATPDSSNATSNTPEPQLNNSLHHELSNSSSSYHPVDKSRQVPELRPLSAAMNGFLSSSLCNATPDMAMPMHHIQQLNQMLAQKVPNSLADLAPKDFTDDKLTEEGKDEPEVDVENVDLAEDQPTDLTEDQPTDLTEDQPTDLTAKSLELANNDDDPAGCLPIDITGDEDSTTTENIPNDQQESDHPLEVYEEKPELDVEVASVQNKEVPSSPYEFDDSADEPEKLQMRHKTLKPDDNSKLRASRSRKHSSANEEVASQDGKTLRNRNTRRRSSSPSVSKTRGSKKTREASVRRGIRKRTPRYDIYNYNHLSEAELKHSLEYEESMKYGSEEEELMKCGSEEREEFDSPTADIKAAVEGLMKQDMSDDVIKSQSKTADESVSYSRVVEEGEDSHPSSQRSGKGYELQERNHNDLSPNANFNHQPTVPKIKLRLNNGPITAVSETDVNANGSN